MAEKNRCWERSFFLRTPHVAAYTLSLLNNLKKNHNQKKKLCEHRPQHSYNFTFFFKSSVYQRCGHKALGNKSFSMKKGKKDLSTKTKMTDQSTNQRGGRCCDKHLFKCPRNLTHQKWRSVLLNLFVTYILVVLHSAYLLYVFWHLLTVEQQSRHFLSYIK